MFGTLLGALPRPPLPADAPFEAIVDACLELQAEHGLEPATDGGWTEARGDLVASWQATAGRADRLVKAVVVGPFSSGRSEAEVRADVVRLGEAGCRWIEVHEPAAVSIGEAADRRARFAEAHQALTRDLGSDLHLSLAITGGNADTAGIDTILAGAYSSVALDLIDGPENWRLAVAVPTERGVVCGALSAHPRSDDGPETLLWAARYAAGSKGRGVARVGLATSGSMRELSWDEAATKVRRLGDAVRIASMPTEAQRAAIDPRAVDARSAALGRVEPRRAAPLETRRSDSPGDPTDA
ncbi:MAG TPA: hypothetical protein VK867_09205 [Candidatus Limnocylindrales bacterium]|nr:hypothetical protein [Candidatus Limnocylindrales bacterium]